MVSISSLSSQIIRNYDTNNDGVISLRGQRPETERFVRDFIPGQNYDTITLTRYDHDKLFAKADIDGDGQVTRDELTGVLKLFDTNNDGELKNSGPFWNRKGELRNYEKAYGEHGVIVDQHLIHHPQPPMPPVPHYPRAVAGSSVGIRIA
ncbi:hypothetical protein COW36_03890 [bacterium (Candidatus Blackallbacteria) CG17_big_fil_post_rev_8_21_14_2_50_48_46]|uniref:EF-hand domain-containing protein n=1 Tax=bacterium (Candidatus Blackallbacteria) CG17_big_fil_post_rev_8_21_14_2_50_48_46 TaxID=2014261 RepID=A0A2M7G8S4_9BACT|nr:MAG: hypothetical protein COW64_05055 [bacterium (Candidatus Blackallbacteria) CG18_big_fil_WC_8_21_14_2_50_49_26]PIW18441.1 MAG: hypothetical protein COW36_03890 [bacterium (Candidatus Blackallbacteria) CG17_big_fil_post_rev_8_21_14_2_50_48_46]PIW46574.1 MAG: hypothetical protein COW20_16790 [bacterium (Candidatus Blackallbacteria) CG13_big_fil_rev_8_21_14_2_50_49_14]